MGNSKFCFPSTLNVPMFNVEGLGETKLTVSRMTSHYKCLNGTVGLLGYSGQLEVDRRSELIKLTFRSLASGIPFCQSKMTSG